MLKRFAQFARPYAPAYAGGFLLLLATNGLGLWIPWLLRDAVESLERHEGLSVITKLALLMLVATSLRLAVRGESRS